jgi:hypothetical protein
MGISNSNANNENQVKIEFLTKQEKINKEKALQKLKKEEDESEIDLVFNYESYYKNSVS